MFLCAKLQLFACTPEQEEVDELINFIEIQCACSNVGIKT